MKIINRALLRDSLSLLPRPTSKKLVLLVLLQVGISILDVFAIILLGIASKIGLDYVQNKTVNFPDALIRILRIENYDFEIQASITALLVLVLFSARTVVSVYSSKRILLYLANQASFASRQIVEKMFRSRPQYIITKNSQEFLYGITSGIDNMTLNYLGSLTMFISEICFLLLMFIVIIGIQPITGIVAVIVFASAAFFINKMTSESAKKYSSENSYLSILYNRKLLETLLVYRELLLRNQEISITEEVQKARSKSLILRARLMLLPTFSKYMFELTLILGGAFIALIELVLSNSLTAISSVTVFLAAASRILPSLIRAQSANISIRQSEGFSEVAIRQLRELEEDENFILHPFERRGELDIFTPKLSVVNLSYVHHDEAKFELENINFVVEAGEFVAIVGESGAGKTTLIDLVLGLLPPKSGSIEISNHEPANAIHRWPGKIAYVPQDIMIIDGDIRKNVALEESREISDEEVLIALEKSHLKSDVLSMKNGLNEIVGERGVRLSGGQRQRLGIARALYTKPQMIFFDEATSSLDPITEKAVTEAIYDKKGNVTLIVVAHRLSTVKNADLVILLEKGKIAAMGTFDEVRRYSPKFDQQAKLVNL